MQVLDGPGLQPGCSFFVEEALDLRRGESRERTIAEGWFDVAVVVMRVGFEGGCLQSGLS
jgi:hypothetical protein